jgi:dihydrofolate reductase
MRKLTVFMHVSLDGFVAGPNGEMDWIAVNEDMFAYAGGRTREADAALYGRVTWRMMDAYWPTAERKPDASQHDIEHSRWYNGVHKYVLSRTLAGTTAPGTTFISRDAESEIAALKRSDGRGIVVFGSPTVVRFLAAADLVDAYWLFVNPVLLGSGIPMFGELPRRVPLSRVSCDALSAGVACLHYARP